MSSNHPRHHRGEGRQPTPVGWGDIWDKDLKKKKSTLFTCMKFCRKYPLKRQLDKNRFLCAVFEKLLTSCDKQSKHQKLHLGCISTDSIQPVTFLYLSHCYATEILGNWASDKPWCLGGAKWTGQSILEFSIFYVFFLNVSVELRVFNFITTCCSSHKDTKNLTAYLLQRPLFWFPLKCCTLM